MRVFVCTRVCTYICEWVYTCKYVSECECASVCIALVVLRWAVHSDVRKWGHFPRNPGYPLFLPTYSLGERPSCINRARSPACLCFSIPHLPTLPPRPVPGGKEPDTPGTQGSPFPNHPRGGTGLGYGVGKVGVGRCCPGNLGPGLFGSAQRAPSLGHTPTQVSWSGMW